MKHLKHGIVLSAVLVTGLAGCGKAEAAAAQGKLAVVATTPQVADFVRTIGGDDVAVTQIIKPGADPHEYEPTPADIQAICTAKLVVKNGVGLERWLDQTIQSAGFSGPVVDSSQGAPLSRGDPGDEGRRPAHLAPPAERRNHGGRHREGTGERRSGA